MDIKLLPKTEKGGYLFRGDDAYLLWRAQKEMIASLPQGELCALNVSIIETPLSDKIIQEASAAPFLSDKRVVIVSVNVKAFNKSDCELFSSFIKAGSGYCALCFVVNEEGLDYREKEALSKCEFMKSTAKRLTLISCAKLPERKVREIAETEFLKGYAIASSALSLLVAECGCDLMRLKHECRKLTAYVGDRREITEEDVKALKIDSFRYSDFALSDALSRGDFKSAIRILDDMLLKNTADAILPLLQKQYRCALHAKLNPKMPQSELGSYLGVGEFYIKNAVRAAQKETPSSLKKKLDALYKAESDFKSGIFDKKNALLNVLLYLSKGEEEWK